MTPAQCDEAELEALTSLVADLGEDEWELPTASAGWDVRAMLGHVLGQYEESASPFLAMRRLRRSHRRYPDLTHLDAHNRLQIEELSALSPDEVVRRLRRVGPKAVRARRRIPKPMRRMNMARFFPEEPLVDTSFGYLVDVLSVRDTWMHRLEISRTTGRPFKMDDHDAEVVAVVMRDLAVEWTGPALVFDLTGPAGGRFPVGAGESTVRVDALDYLWLLSGREGVPQLSIDGDESVRDAVLSARVVF